jgi:hypothetical protein
MKPCLGPQLSAYRKGLDSENMYYILHNVKDQIYFFSLTNNQHNVREWRNNDGAISSMPLRLFFWNTPECIFH